MLTVYYSKLYFDTHMVIIYYFICGYKSNNKQNSKTIITAQSSEDVLSISKLKTTVKL